MTLPRGYLTGTAIALALAWVPYALSPGSGLVAPGAQTLVHLGLAVLTARSRRLKIPLVRTAQRWVINPVVRSLFAVGPNPLGLVILDAAVANSVFLELPVLDDAAAARIGDDAALLQVRPLVRTSS